MLLADMEILSLLSLTGKREAVKVMRAAGMSSCTILTPQASQGSLSECCDCLPNTTKQYASVDNNGSTYSKSDGIFTKSFANVVFRVFSL